MKGVITFLLPLCLFHQAGSSCVPCCTEAKLTVPCSHRWLNCSLQCPSPTVMVALNDGTHMPVLAFSASMGWHDPKQVERATSAAIAAGFRMFWNSVNLGPASQRAMMRAIVASGIPRSELYIAGSISTLVPGSRCVDEESCYRMARSQAELQLKVLTVGGAPLDQLMVVDFPRTADCALVRGPWRALEELKAAGRVVSLATANVGVDDLGGSNAWKLRCLANATTPPAVSQEPFCIGHAHSRARSTLAAHHGIVLQAYSPLGDSGALLHDPIVAAVALAHNVSTAAVALRWITQRNATLVTESDDANHLRDDGAIFEFTLSDAQLASLDAVTSDVMCGNWSLRLTSEMADDTARGGGDGLEAPS